MIKKILNDPKEAAFEALEGLHAAYLGETVLDAESSILYKKEIPENKVGLLVGGGSGHEPLFAGFVGENLADGAVCGNIFAAPSPPAILAATQAIHRGKGILYLYGNYAGDNMNFDLAANLAESIGITTKTVRIWDDVASAPLDKIEERRGIAGDLFVIKIAGAAASQVSNLDELVRITAKARDFTRSLGVAVAPGSIPETGELTFQIGDDEIEIGMGLHGEPGVVREKMMTADVLVDRMMSQIVSDLPFNSGDEVCVLINNLGATTMMELYIVNRCVNNYLRNAGINIHDTLIGSYCTSQEMAGFSISLLKLDDELTYLYDKPANSLAFVKR